MNYKLEGCPFCGSDEMDWADHREGCYLKMMDELLEGKENHSPYKVATGWNTRYEPKHETVEQWEERTGETYPEMRGFWWIDQDMDFFKENGYHRLRPIENKYQSYKKKYPEYVFIVANHHGKPHNIEGDR